MVSNGSISVLSPVPGRMKVILASNSPRRRQLLGMIIDDFTVAEPREVDEVYPSDMPHELVPVFLSQLKASAYADMLTADSVLITADTVVLLDGRILGKPNGREEAIAMLTALAGRDHTVVTGVTITSGDGRADSFAEHTRVSFGAIAQEEIYAYVDSYRPYDKAGAYGIQEWIGGAGIKGIDGCFYNVMGLPLHSLYVHLRRFFGR